MYLLFKNAFLKVRKSLGRFISLLLIVALGVGFFAGIRSSPSSMLNSIDNYFDGTNLMDFKIQSSMGITEDDVDVIRKLDNVSMVEPSYTLDALSEGKSIRIHSILDNINKIDIISGRMPSKQGECVADSQKYKIGDLIRLDDINENLSNNEFLVVGTMNSSMYLYRDYGISNVGNGKLASYIYVLEDNFSTDYYTEVYIIASNTTNSKIYSNEYDEYINNLKQKLIEIEPLREKSRYDEIINEAEDKIKEEENKFIEEREKGQNELDNAKLTLDKNKSELQDAKNQIKKNESQLNKTITEKNNEFEIAKKNISDAWNQINSNLSSYGISINSLDSKIQELQNNISYLNQILETIQEGTDEYNNTKENINEANVALSRITVLKKSINELDSNEKELNNGISLFNEQISTTKKQISKAKSDIEENEKKLNEGYDEYNKNLEKYNIEIKDAQSKIDDARQEIKDIDMPSWYIFDRTDNKGYIDMRDDAKKVSVISDIFPLFFMLVVALMSLNTMVRMIEEERTELGTLTSLGYSNFKITSIYIIYVVSSTVVGIISGYFLGILNIPKIIYSVYNNNYILPNFVLDYNITMFITITTIVLALMIGVTIFVCHSELKSKPANLLRPVAPKNGKKILLERIKFIWKRLSFTLKVTSRNIFRYKKRVFMIIIGIAGCTALLVTGFGIRDSIEDIADIQFKNIFKYDALMAIDKDVKDSNDESIKYVLENNKILNPLLINQSNFTFVSQEKNIDTYVIVPEKDELFSEYYNLKSKISGNKVELPQNGVIITQKIASLLKLKIGDNFEIKDSDGNTYKLYISDIVENYTFHYIYINKTEYEKNFNDNITYNFIVSDINEDEDIIASNLISSGEISYVNFASDNLTSFNSLISGLNSIIYIIIGASSLLALIVLYNLTAINISERQREIATLKVLGFYDKDVSEYIYRETLFLTLIGIIVGLFLGIFFHSYIITLTEIDSTVFIRNIKPASFIYSFLIILVFTFAVQLITHFNLKKIDMTTSLKSVE